MSTKPDWLVEILDAIYYTDGVDKYKWASDADGIITVTIHYGVEELTFRAGSDDRTHGVQYDGGIHEMTNSEQVQWWCAEELYDRLQKTKAELERLNTNSNNHD